jgi:hypothetical protein
MIRVTQPTGELTIHSAVKDFFSLIRTGTSLK